MPNYLVYEKSSGIDVYAYNSDVVSNAEVYPLALYSHVAEESNQFDYHPGDKRTKWLIDIGPFFDRFSTNKYSILMSTDPVVRVIVDDVRVRKWVDLSRLDVGQAIDVLIAKNLCHPTMKDDILTSPVMPLEQVALMATYGESLNNGN